MKGVFTFRAPVVFWFLARLKFVKICVEVPSNKISNFNTALSVCLDREGSRYVDIPVTITSSNPVSVVTSVLPVIRVDTLKCTHCRTHRQSSEHDTLFSNTWE